MAVTIDRLIADGPFDVDPDGNDASGDETDSGPPIDVPQHFTLVPMERLRVLRRTIIIVNGNTQKVMYSSLRYTSCVFADAYGYLADHTKRPIVDLIQCGGEGPEFW